MVFIYILKLEQNKYYVGKTNNPITRIEDHINSSASEWTKKYKPIQIYQLIPDCDSFDEDKYTKIYMDKYGINNVRGGQYCKINLSNDVIKIIQQGLNSTNDKCYLCNKLGHFAKECNTRNNIIYCEFCNHECKDENYLQRHLNDYCKKNKIYCKFCNKECEDDNYLKRHLQLYCKNKVKDKVKNIYCGFCNHKCKDKDYLQRHLHSYCEKNKIHCKICNKECEDDNYLKKHLKLYCKEEDKEEDKEEVIDDYFSLFKNSIINYLN